MPPWNPWPAATCNATKRFWRLCWRGGGTEAQRQVVALNSALVLWSAGKVSHWAEGVEAALAALAAGEPWRRLQALSKALAPAEG